MRLADGPVCDKVMERQGRLDVAMRFVIEFEGVLFDIGPAYHEAHRRAATEVGWSRLDQPTFWRLIRTKGRDANMLPGARPAKTKEYIRRFEEWTDRDEVIGRFAPRPGAGELMEKLMRHGTCVLASLGANLAARQQMLGVSDLEQWCPRLAMLNPDPRLRPGELRALAKEDSRTIVVTANDSMIRAAGQAELIAVGISTGACGGPRLRQAGADLVFESLDELVGGISSGGEALVRAGMLPLPWG
jgi:phosphoglycolate phosphatase-like HAD superfamily hydrolase